MSILDQIYAKAKENPQKVAFPEAANEKMMQAAYEAGRDGYMIPILVGNAEQLKALCAERGYDPAAFAFVDMDDEEYKSKVVVAYVAREDTLLKEKALRVGVKLIQQFGHADAYGPMLQGFNSVVCDCSRGAPVSEIKGNIIISAVRAAGMKR